MLWRRERCSSWSPCAGRSAGASGHIGSILCLVYIDLMLSEMPWGIQGLCLGVSDVTQDLWEIQVRFT